MSVPICMFMNKHLHVVGFFSLSFRLFVTGGFSRAWGIGDCGTITGVFEIFSSLHVRAGLFAKHLAALLGKGRGRPFIFVLFSAYLEIPLILL